MTHSETSYFSIPFQHVPAGRPLEFDLFINSSVLEEREKFVRIFPKGGVLSREEIARFKSKFLQVYIAEAQRDAYLQSLVATLGTASPEEKVDVLKNSAIRLLEDLFLHKDSGSEALTQSIEGCKEVVENMVDALNDQTIDTLKELIANLSFHDFYTYDHSVNVSMYCIMIFKTLKPHATRSEVVEAGLAGLLHDVGKVRIPTYIINKPGKLSEDEFAQIRRHPGYGFEFLCQPGVRLPLEIDAAVMARVILEHHENFDGTGYPNRLDGERIHLLARITAVADFFDAVTTKRSYHRPMNTADALALMRRSSGKKLDPQIFEMFALHTAHFEKNRTCPHELDSDFDPCQPQQVLPLKRIQERLPETGGRGFGRIKVIGKPEDLKDWANRRNVTIIDSTQNPKSKTTPRKKSG